MSIEPYSYSIFFEFIESYLASSFLDINADDPILRKLEDVMDANDQFFFCYGHGTNEISVYQ